MVRPKKADRGSIALTHVRISLTTKQLIDELRLKHGFTTTDQVLQYYLLFRPTIDDNASIDRLVKGASNEIMRTINKSSPDQSKSKPVHKQTSSSWQRQRKSRKF